MSEERDILIARAFRDILGAIVLTLRELEAEREAAAACQHPEADRVDARTSGDPYRYYCPGCSTYQSPAHG